MASADKAHHREDCPSCGGGGMDPLGDRPCDVCAGYGRVPADYLALVRDEDA
jgi:hypothetical protein